MSCSPCNPHRQPSALCDSVPLSDVYQSPPALSGVRPAEAPYPHSRSLLMALLSLIDRQSSDAEGDNAELLPTPEQLPSEFSSGQRETRHSRNESYSMAESSIAPGDAGFDFETSLRDVVNKMDRSDIKRRELGVLFDNLQVVGLGSSAAQQLTLGSTLNPFTWLSGIQSMRHPTTRTILSGFEGVVRPGEMLLVLGRPGAGCSTLLRTLANQRGDYHAVNGEVHYDSLTPDDINRYCRGDVQYCPEDDVHFPTLTVDQTLAFAALTRTPNTRLDAISRQKHVQVMTDALKCVFGLRHVQNTLVGDASIRGVSGGEKKRVSISETLAMRSLLTCWDNSTRGLDSSTALEFVRAIRTVTNVTAVSTIVSIYQAGEPLYELFDKVCVIYEGKMAYFGPAKRARQYFIDMGYEPAHRQTTADFLVAVTDPNGRIPRADCRHAVPRTAEEFADYYRKTEIYLQNRADMGAYRKQYVGKPQRAAVYLESVRSEHAGHASSSDGSYLLSLPMQVRALMTRRVQIMRGNMTALLIELASFIILALIVGTIYLRLKANTDTFFSRASVIFFAYVWSGLSTMAEIPTLFAQRPIILRQYKAAMYHPFVEALSMTLVDIPITFVTMVAFSLILYFLAGLQQSACQFFIFMLFVFVMTITLKAFFRSITAAVTDPAAATAAAGILMLFLVLYTGYPIPLPSMIRALRWITLINPLRYGFESLMVNEFHTLDAECDTLVPSGAGYENITLANQGCAVVGSLPGQATVSGIRYVEFSYGFFYSHLWPGFGILLAFCLAFIATLIFFTEINTGSTQETSAVLFKAGSTPHVSQSESSSTDDVEKAGGPASQLPASGVSISHEKAAKSEGNVFSWQQLNYTVPVSGGHYRQLLTDVSGYVAPGKLTALMGESGAGKTTLLNVLSDRAGQGIVNGERLLNGQPLPADFQSQTGYCQQTDTHVASTTVREALLFSAKLRQPQSVPLAEKEAYVDQCLRMCGLEAYADAIVGTLGSEQRKRTTVGVELVAKPSLIFLDEPTSGLDSQSAWAIVSFLRKLADSGQSIVCTIHQPSAELFEVFDKLLLLRKGGETVYFGDLGPNASTVISYFEQNGSRPCGEQENPAEFILDVVGAGATASSIIDWHSIWNQSREVLAVQHELAMIRVQGKSRPLERAVSQSEFATSWWYQLVTLLQRDARGLWRDPVYLIAKMAVNILCALIIGFTYFKSKHTMQGTENQLFSIYISTFLAAPLVEQLQVPFLDMRNIYEIRERHSRMYSWSALLTSQFLVEIPWNILGSSLFFLCWYWTAGFPTHRAPYTYLLFGIIYPVYYTSFGQATAAMSPNAEIAALIFNALFAIIIVFDGVLQPFRELGRWTWMNRISPSTYFVEGFLGQAVGRTELTCSNIEFVQINPPIGQTCSQFLQQYITQNGGYVNNPNATSTCDFCLYRTTDEFLKSRNIFYSDHWRSLGIFCAFTLFNVLAIYTLTYFCRIRTGSLKGWLRRRSLTRWKNLPNLSS
ncbi:pleiotropic drug resistance ABC transporter [Wolfiporia cocos MD-104 SS10]|uniref:Pleiotropic drug resistance ABC transporter n=1 Tax=Wolfiporia cocos (strain MD-104) TaxID=742152 RepID=A0A2H3IZH9_WOLCO|nr:pleiotropic drug resistance ABC transporter [Wolfiporia cocos MD-104 SS10]